MNLATDFHENYENTSDGKNNTMNEENKPNQLNTEKAELQDNKPIVNISHFDIDDNEPKDFYFGEFAVDKEEKKVITIITVETITVENNNDDWKVPSKRARIEAHPKDPVLK